MIAALHRGEKRLVFCDSRARVEALAAELRQSGAETFVSHSSLALDERRRSEEAFSQSRDCVIVATSTLELGIDVGDLDRVIQIDAPATVASFLQRLGRTGRRAGTVRNCLFLATSDDGFLRTSGLLRLWLDGYVEPVVPPPEPFHIFAQQLLALALQEGRVGRRTWRDWLGEMPAFRATAHRHLDDVIGFMLARGMPVRRRRDAVDGRRGRARLRPPALHGPPVGVHRRAALLRAARTDGARSRAPALVSGPPRRSDRAPAGRQELGR